MTAIASLNSRLPLDSTLARLKERAPAFAALSIAERLELLEHIRQAYFALLPEAIREGCRAKGLDPEAPEAGEEWLAHGLCVVRHLRLLKQSLREIAQFGSPRLEAGKFRTRAGGGQALKVYPSTPLEALTFPGITAEVYLRRELTREQILENQAPFYKKPHRGKLALVLGAGNVPSIPPRDVLTKMFNEGKVCILKVNPVNAYLGPFLERAFAEAIRRGFFAVVYGGAEEGGYLSHHPLVDEVHITGSDRTHDAIVWGPPGPEREERRRRGEPLLAKEITSELGNVSPVIVIPGAWTEPELCFQAENVAGMVTNNASFNCNAAKLLVQARLWPKREGFLAQIERSLASTPLRRAYYPGAAERFRLFTEGRRGVSLIGRPREGELPWAIVPDVDARDAADRAFTTEPWCSVLDETALGSPDPTAFLEEAVRFLNERVWGTLCATVLAPAAALADPGFARVLEQAIEDLRYGTVALNLWPAVGFSLGSTPWGGHPSSTLADIQSGRGFISNTLMLEGVEKVVVRAPPRTSPKPPWFPSHRTCAELGRSLTELEKEGSWSKLPSVAWAALRG
jgi:aldehyde dehydrogenase (NAD(P)+)